MRTLPPLRHPPRPGTVHVVSERHRPNIVLITLDQFRGDALSAAGHPLVRTPHLDYLATHGVRLARHYSQAAPCGPGRASLYTGMYQFNHRVVANGTPLDDRFDNLARAARRAGYRPALFGYTDQSVDPRVVTDDNDPRLENFEGILPGFDPVLPVVREQDAWRRWLGEQGHRVPATGEEAWATEPQRPAEHSLAAFLTGGLIEWLGRQDRPWFAHLSHLRPHPPYAAAGRFSTMYDPADVALPIAPSEDRHRLHEAMLTLAATAAPSDEGTMRRLIAQYYGMVSEVDDQLGRLWAALKALGQWDDTVVVVTSDHGEYLGDHGLVEKGGFFAPSYHIVGIVRDPSSPAAHGTVVSEFTENVDVFPTLCDLMGIGVPAQCDGLPLTPFLRGDAPPWWRDAAHWEYDWRDVYIGDDAQHPWPWDRRLERQHLAVRMTDGGAFVQFGDGSWRCFDLAADPTWRTVTEDPADVLPHAQAMLTWRSRHTDRTLADSLIRHGVRGRRPPARQDEPREDEPMTDLTAFIDGIDFGEGPRWHDGRLWYSDFYQHTVYAVDTDGTRTAIVEVAGQPSGLGWMPDGTMLIVSMVDRKVLRFDGSTLSEHADLSGIAAFHCNDMVVDASGNAYVGNFGFDLFTDGLDGAAPAKLALVRADGTAEVAADGLMFPNGSVITPDGSTLIVGETMGARYTAYDIGPDATLSNSRTWATVDGFAPDGCTLDDAGGIWFADAVGARVARVIEGGEITDVIDTGAGTFACALGGDDGRTLFILTAPGASPADVAGVGGGAIVTARVEHARAGRP